MAKKEQVHTHMDADGMEYTHSHEDGQEHKHTHENTKAVLNRLSRASGHLESVKRMIEDGKDCSEVLIQLSAVIAALNNAGKVILQDHIEHCIVDAIESGDNTAIENLNKAIDRFIK
jgi:CsoR family transcriptional regulator, copper-sensing transcriptional repressor